MKRNQKSTTPGREVRFQTATAVEIREADNSPGILTGYAAVYDSETDLGWFREVIRPGAFTRAVSEEQDVRALWNHETGIILGRTSAGTLTLTEDARGLAFELTLPDTQAGRDAATSIRRRDITGMSFGFQVAKARWIEEEARDSELREILDLNLFEISPVTFPAYADTDVGLRSLETFQAERAGKTNRRKMRARQLRLRHTEITRRIKSKTT